MFTCLCVCPIGNVDDDMSLIIIEAGFSKPVKDATFKPLFMTPVVDEATQKMITETCGGNSECEYDIAVTGIVDVGKTTLTDIEEHVAIVRQSLPSMLTLCYSKTLPVRNNQNENTST